MIAVLILLLFLLGLWAFIVWDRKLLSDTEENPMSREAMKKGFTPSGVVAWQVWISLGTVSAFLAFTEWRTPSHPPFSGRWSWVNASIYQIFGEKGMVAAYSAVACCAIFYGLALIPRRKQ